MISDHRRRSPRLPAYDYREVGVYFVTICTHRRACVFGSVNLGEMVLNDIGRIARKEWMRTFELRPFLEQDVFVVMPNHVHLLFGMWTGEDAGWSPGMGGGTDGRNGHAARRDTMHGVPTLIADRRFGNHGADSVSSA